MTPLFHVLYTVGEGKIIWKQESVPNYPKSFLYIVFTLSSTLLDNHVKNRVIS